MPYNTADVNSACKFITTNIPSVADLVDGTINETIGDAKFTLIGNRLGDSYSSFELYITKPNVSVS